MAERMIVVDKLKMSYRFKTRGYVGVFVLLAMIAHVSTAYSGERRDTRPNILFAIADDWSFGHAGAYGCSWISTPTFDRVAKQGLLFRRAYTPNAKCAPSRACILTGRNSWQLKDACNHVCYFPSEFKGFCEALAENGYQVGYTGKGWGPGVAKAANSQLRQLTGRPFNARRMKPPAQAMSNLDYAANFVDFLKESTGDGPWCFWYGTMEPHRGFEYGVGVANGRSLTDIKRVPGYWPDNERIRNDMLDYGFEVEYFDQHLGRILQALEDAGELANTLVIVTSDHGMPFPRCKGQAYEASNHVPLAIMWGDQILHPDREVNEYVSFIDFAPTILEVAQLDAEQVGMQPSPGKSLNDLFRNEPTTRDFVVLGKERHDIGRPHDWGYPIRGIIHEDYLYLRNHRPERWPAGNPRTGYLNCDGSPTKTWILDARRNGSDPSHWQLCFGKRPAEELYFIKGDPDCLNNLASDASYAARKEALAKRLNTVLVEQRDPRTLGQPHYFDLIRFSNVNHRDFYQRYLAGERIRAGWVNPGDFEKEEIDAP